MGALQEVYFMVQTHSLVPSTLRDEAALELYSHLGVEIEAPHGWVETARVIEALVEKKCIDLAVERQSSSPDDLAVTRHLQSVVLSYMLGNKGFWYEFRDLPAARIHVNHRTVPYLQLVNS